MGVGNAVTTPRVEVFDEDDFSTLPEITPEEDLRPDFPPPIIKLDEEKRKEFEIWLDQGLKDLQSEQSTLQKEWAEYEDAYRARSGAQTEIPFRGANKDTVPVIAMNVDPIHARLDTGIFKNDPVFVLKALKSSMRQYVKPLEWWIEYYQKNKLKLRKVASPRMLECAKLGTMVFKTVYESEKVKRKGYDEQWNVVDVEETGFRGPKVYGVRISDFLFPALYQDIQDCPIIAERQRTTFSRLKQLEASGKLANVNELRAQDVKERTEHETSLEEAGSQSAQRYEEDIEDLVVYEIWCDYDIDGDGLPEHLVVTWHESTRTILQLRYNWYFHQKKPYTLIPYSVTSGGLHGIGVSEMVKPFQDMLTNWQRMASDNAYIANIRMFIARKDSGIEEVPRLYAGRVFYVEEPTKDFVPFAAGEIYPSTLTERQNLMGMVEKRTGISDYLTGRESPLIGSRATATTTIALIQEGTRRVEEVLENIRDGFGEIMQFCIDLWIQYGIEDLNDVAFDDDEIGAKINEFFSDVVTREKHRRRHRN